MNRRKRITARRLRQNGHRMRWEFRVRAGYWLGTCRRCGGGVSVTAEYVAPDIRNWRCS